jgi:uncharacterized membrane protein YbhN (UPF0104 family)
MQTKATIMRLSLVPTSQMWLNRIGKTLGTIGVFFVVFQLYQYQSQLNLAKLGTNSYLVIATLAVVYGASNLLLAVGWRNILLQLSVHTSCRWAIWVYATSQLAKYVPGNIFQYAGRQVLGLAAGIGNGPLAKASILELAIIALAGILFVPLALPAFLPEMNTGTATILYFSIVTVSSCIAYKIWGKKLVFTIFYYISFLLLSGLLFSVTFYVASGEKWNWNEVSLLSGAYVLAWLAGLLTPGAPAGLGVREVVLISLLSGIATAPVVLLSVVLGRIITVLGDLMFFLAGSTVKISNYETR